MTHQIIHPGNFECFIGIYTDQLKIARIKYPKQYPWPENDLPSVVERMRAAILKGTFNKDSHALKATCKELKIKHTYKAIKEFISL